MREEKPEYTTPYFLKGWLEVLEEHKKSEPAMGGKPTQGVPFRVKDVIK